MGRWRKLGLIAGGGALPLLIANACRARGDDFHIVRLAGFADPDLSDFASDECAIGEAGKILRLLKEQSCDAVVLAGNVLRPDFKTLKVDWRGAAMLPKMIAAAARGDGALLSVLVETFESEGMLVIGAEEVVNSLTASAGAFGAIFPDDDNIADMRKAAQVIKALGSFDVGQAAVVANGLVVAIEAAEGTDEMLARCALLPDTTKGGVLVKRPKPGQELRIDLPVIGPETIRRAHAAGLKGVAVETGAALVIDHDEIVRLADRENLFVYGFSPEEVRQS